MLLRLRLQASMDWVTKTLPPHKFDGNSHVIASVGEGVLTSSGHFISIAGTQVRNGIDYYIVYDPNYARSSALGRFTNNPNIIDKGIEGKILVKSKIP